MPRKNGAFRACENNNVFLIEDATQPLAQPDPLRQAPQVTGTELEEAIYAWLYSKYPEGPTWFDQEVVTVDVPPLEARMLYAFNKIEYNIANGGWSQFLWNCMGSWRKLIETAAEGYNLIGAAEQAKALSILHALCEQDEPACLQAIAREDGNMDTFAEYTKRSYLSKSGDWEELFWGGIYERRLAWLEANESRIRAIIGLLDG